LGPHTAGRLFVGRGDGLAELETALAAGSDMITTGLDGVGKSTLVHRFAEVHRDRYNPIWWIDAEGLASRLGAEWALISNCNTTTPGNCAQLPGVIAREMGLLGQLVPVGRCQSWLELPVQSQISSCVPEPPHPVSSRHLPD
jgi:hypothetical protein